MAEEVKKTTRRKAKVAQTSEESTVSVAPVSEEVKEEKVVSEKEAKKAAKKAEKEAKKAEKQASKKAAKKEKEEVKPSVESAKAVAKNIRSTPRKARLVIDLVRGKDVKVAVGILKNTNKSVASDVLKVVNSAAANAINNFNMNEDKLYIAEIYATDGSKMRRYLPRAKGSASGLVKRMCHITVVVKERK